MPKSRSSPNKVTFLVQPRICLSPNSLSDNHFLMPFSILTSRLIHFIILRFLSTSKEIITYCCFSWPTSGLQELRTRKFEKFPRKLLRRSLFLENFWAISGSFEDVSQNYTSPVHT